MQKPSQTLSTSHRTASPRSGEEGYMMLAVVVMAALMLIALSVAAPVIARDIRRDKEVESEHRAQQYLRAIRLYYKKFGSYPPSMDALEKSNNIRFLRKQYVDPLTGKSDWRVIHMGQQKTTIKLPFGEELAGLGAGGLGSAAGMASTQPAGIGSSGIGSSGSGSSTIGSTSALASGFSGATVGSSSTTSSASGASTTGATGSSSGFGSSSSSSGGLSGGGGPIAGVGTSRSGDSILTPNQQTTYDTWEFWYDPRIEAYYKASQILGGGGIGAAASVSSGGITSTSASSFGSDINGTSNAPKSTGSSGNSGSATTPPQQ